MPIISCQCFHSNSLTCCYNLASILHESLNWVLLFLKAAPETGNMMWRTGKWKDDKTSQHWYLWLMSQWLCQQWKAWLPHPHQYTTVHVKRYYPQASTGNKRHNMGPHLCKPLLLLYTKWGWRWMHSGCRLNSQGGVHMQGIGQSLKKKNLLLYEMQTPRAELSYLLLLQTLQVLEMVMWKD